MSNRAARRREAKHPAGRTPSMATAVAPMAASAEAEALVVTHYFDGDDLQGSATVRLSGRRVGAHGHQNVRDTFNQEDRVDRIVGGSGPTSLTSWVYGLAPGEWEVAAEVVRPTDRRASVRPILPARWSWRRWSLSADAPTRVKTRFAPLAPLAGIPAVIPGIWPVLGAIAVLLAVVIQRVLLPHENVAVEVPLIVPLAALAAGLLGAKVWYAFLHPGPWRTALLGGWAVDGFLVVAPMAAIAILLALGLPVAKFLDAVTPGLFVAVAIGRIGCFFAGCCAGRVTDSRWGIWSSDRKVGARRIPAQILESLAGLAIAAVTTVLILDHAPRIDGAIFIGAFAVYVVVRQALLRVRAERREFLWRRTAASRHTA
jgi:phosphatidylglycerol---prolipoprotein diacylglyceryl transferase